MPSFVHNASPSQALVLIGRLEMALIAAVAVLLPFDHWFFGHIVNPAPIRVVGFALTLVWLVQIVTGQMSLRFQPWHATALIFVGICFFSALFSPVISNPAIDNYPYKLLAATKIATALLFLALACQALNHEKLLLLLRTYVVFGIGVCAVSLLLYIAHMSKIYSHGFALWVEKDIYNFVRIQGVSAEPHRFGAYAMSLLPWLLLPKVRALIRLENTLSYFALALVFICLMLAYSVAVYIALPFLMLILAIQSLQSFFIMLRIVFVAAAVVSVLLLIPAVSVGTQEIIDVKVRGDSLNDRIFQWMIAGLQTGLYPWTGVGPEGYSYFIGELNPLLKNATPASNPPQNMLLGIMANTGLPGLASFLVFIFTFFASCLRRYQLAINDRTMSHAALAIAISHFVYQQSIWLPWSLNQWLYMAIAWAALIVPPSQERQSHHVQT